MAAPMTTVIRHLRRAVLRTDGAGWKDGQLLASFIADKDEAAFEALVRRHGPMVLGVCRRLLRNHHDAEDAFQATFLVLARKASSVRPREKVANWLHGVARRTALKARSLTAKRRRHEQQGTEMPEPETTQQDPWRDVQPLLDQELNGLPENYRLAILLCDLEGKTIKEAARQLGWPQGTVAGRLARGRKLLAKRLASRGVVLSAGSLVAVVTKNVATAAVPSALVSSTVKAASVLAVGQTSLAGMVPAKIAALMEGVLKAMLIAKLKTVTAAVLLVAAVGIGGGLLSRSGTMTEVQAAEERLPKAGGDQQVSQTRTGSVVLNERNFDTGFVLGVNSDAGLSGSLVLKERNFDTGLRVGLNAEAAPAGLYFVPFVDSGTVSSSSVPTKAKTTAPKTDLDRLQGVWSVFWTEIGGERYRAGKAEFMVDGKRACWQTEDSEIQGGLYLDPTSKPKSYDLAMSTRTIEGIYALEGDSLRLCYDLGAESKRPGSFLSEKGSRQVLVVLKRIHGPEVFPFRLQDGTRAFPTLIERATTPSPPPRILPQPKDPKPNAPRTEESEQPTLPTSSQARAMPRSDG